MIKEPMVVCPLCKGTKHSPYAPYRTCQTCEGVGKISQSKQEALARIRSGIAARMKARGIEL